MTARNPYVDRTPQPCDCGKPHVTIHGHRSCSVHRKSDGEPCPTAPLDGGKVCRMHGGGARQNREAAAKRLEKAKTEALAEKLLLKIGHRVERDPVAHLLDVISYQAGIVAYWRAQVEDIAPESLTWGVTEKKTGFNPTTTLSASPNVAYELLRDAQSDLVRYCAEAIKVGFAERQVQIAEQQGALMAGLQRAVLARMLATTLDILDRQGVRGSDVIEALREGWAASASVVVPQEIRALMSGQVVSG